MGDLSVELECVLFAALLDDIDRGWLQRYPMADAAVSMGLEVVRLLARDTSSAGNSLRRVLPSVQSVRN